MKISCALTIAVAARVALAEDAYCCNDRSDLVDKLQRLFETGSAPTSAPIGSWDVSRIQDCKFPAVFNDDPCRVDRF